MANNKSYYQNVKKDELIRRILKAEEILENAEEKAKEYAIEEGDGFVDYAAKSGGLKAYIDIALRELREGN